MTLLPSAAMLSAWGSAAATVNLTAMLADRGIVPPGRPTTILGTTATAAAGALLTVAATTTPGRSGSLTAGALSATLNWP